MPIHMPFDGWALSHIHEPHCPEHEDNHPATEVQLVGLAEDVLHDHAEAIWAATRDGEEE
jgi:hypothetical protein